MKTMKMAASLLAVLALQGCMAQKRDYVEVATFGDTASIALLNDQLKELYKKEGIKARPVYVPYASFSQKVIGDLAAKAAPDVLWVEAGFYVTLQRAGALESLSPLIKQDKLDLKQFYSGILNRFTRDGEVYALPNDTAPVGLLYYNKALFKKAGLKFPDENWTWAKLLEAARAIKKDGANGRTEVWGYQDQYGTDWMNWIFSNGGSMVDDVKNPTRCLMAEPNAVEAVQFLHDLIFKHKVFEQQGNREQIGASGADLFLANRLGMFRSGYWAAGQLRRDGKDLDWDIAPFPKGPRAKTFRWGTGGSGWAMSRDVRNKEKAWKVLKFLAGEDYQRRLMRDGGTQPALKKLAALPEFIKPEKPANAKMLLWAPDFAVYSPEIKEYEEILRSVVEPRMDKILTDPAAKPGPVLKEIAAEYDKRLKAIKKP